MVNPVPAGAGTSTAIPCPSSFRRRAASVIDHPSVLLWASMYYTISSVVKIFPPGGAAARFRAAGTVECRVMKRPSTPPSTVSDVLANVLRRVDPEQQLPAYR